MAAIFNAQRMKALSQSDISGTAGKQQRRIIMADAAWAQRMGITEQEAATADYIGDGVYVWTDGHHIWLGTLEGARIALEPSVFDNLNDFRSRMIAEGKVPQK
jgi:hypothetical protein